MLWDASELQIDYSPEAGQPVYRQIAERIRTLVLQGQIHPGTRLPAVRRLARSLNVATATVQRAYSDLRTSGLIEAKGGSGTVVSSTVGRVAGTAILANLTRGGAISTYERLSDSIGVRSLATAVPDPDLFHADEFIAELDDLRTASPWVWYYGPPTGAPELQRQVAVILRSRGIEASDDHILITNGSTGATALVLHALAPPGSTVLIEQPSFIYGQDLLDLMRLKSVGIPTGQNGIDIDAFKKAGAKHERSLLIVSPTFHSATGGVLCEPDRKQLLLIARKHGITVVEVDRYRYIAYEEPPPSLAAMDPEVVYIDSFSYCLSPGLRTGYIKAPYNVAAKLIAWCKATDISGPLAHQMALAGYIGKGRLSAHIKRSLPEYRARRNALLHALELNMPKGTSWTTPAGGYASWLTLPATGNYGGLYDEAIANGVAFTPSELLLKEPDDRQLRVAFGCQDVPSIHEAVQTLGRLVHRRV
jgi:2-aminoadipate transaminase